MFEFTFAKLSLSHFLTYFVLWRIGYGDQRATCRKDQVLSSHSVDLKSGTQALSVGNWPAEPSCQL